MANRTLGAIPTELRNIQGHERLYAVDLNANVPRDRYLQLSTVIASAQVRNLGQFNISSQNRTVALPTDVAIGGSVFFSWSGGQGYSRTSSTDDTNSNSELIIAGANGSTINGVAIALWRGHGWGRLELRRTSANTWNTTTSGVWDTVTYVNREFERGTIAARTYVINLNKIQIQRSADFTSMITLDVKRVFTTDTSSQVTFSFMGFSILPRIQQQISSYILASARGTIDHNNVIIDIPILTLNDSVDHTNDFRIDYRFNTNSNLHTVTLSSGQTAEDTITAILVGRWNNS